jgi:urease accessory protein
MSLSLNNYRKNNLQNAISGKIDLEFIDTKISKQAVKKVYQYGYSKVRFVNTDNNNTEAILINTAGGLTSSDIIENDIKMNENSKAVITSQAAEKIYKNISGIVSINTNIEMDKNSFIQWLPQETIIFDQSKTKRKTSVYINKYSKFLGLESVMFGRQLHGEKIKSGFFSDHWKIYLNEKLSFVDKFIVEENFKDKLLNKFIFNNVAFMSTIIFYSEELENNTKDIADFIINKSDTGGFSIINGIGIIKIVDKKPHNIKIKLNNLIQLIQKNVFNYNYGLPRIWNY